MKKIQDMTVTEFLAAYRAKLVETADGDRVQLSGVNARNKAQLSAYIDAHRTEVFAELRQAQITANEAEEARKAAAAAREAKIAAIEGLEAIKDADEEWRQFRREFNRRMEDEYLSSILPVKPESDPEALRKQYPRAAAYLTAEAWSNADHYKKCSAGKKALERIINGEDYIQALADMNAEWTAYCTEHIWD